MNVLDGTFANKVIQTGAGVNETIGVAVNDLQSRAIGNHVVRGHAADTSAAAAPASNGLTGGDTIQARALYREPFEFKPQFKMVLCCNDKPDLPEHDQGTWRRVRNTDFITAFRPEPKEECVLQFKLDDTLSEKMENWTEPFMSFLLHYNKKYKHAGRDSPSILQSNKGFCLSVCLCVYLCVP